MDKRKKQPDIDITEVGAGRKCSGLDLISRRAAIDEIKALYEWHDTVTEDRTIDHLKRLPSAEPNVPDTNVGDMISRQDAIDALWELRRNIQMMDNSQGADIVLHGIFLAEKKIQSLPSAEPNLQPTCNQLATEIIYCKDCKHRFLQDRIWQCPFAIPAFDNHFCAYAERKEDE